MASTSGFVLYGANGFTGKLILERAVARGLRPVVAGRDAQAVRGLAREYGLPAAVAETDQTERLLDLLGSATLLLNAAGPFSKTAAPLLEACIETGTHYVDVSGEIGVFQASAYRDQEARTRGTMLMPGAGYEIVLSDCLATHVAARVPKPTLLRVGFEAPRTPSRGSLRTAMNEMRDGAWVCREGKLVKCAAGSLTHSFDFDGSPAHSTAISGADVASAYYSTGICNIETYLRTTASIWSYSLMTRYWGWAMSVPGWQYMVDQQLRLLPAGPSRREQRTARTTIVAEVSNRRGDTAIARMKTPEAYRFTSRSAVRIARRILAGDFQAGFRTPAQVYGSDFALSFRGVTREDL